MIAVINDIDRLLQAAPSRYGEAYDLELRLTASAPAFTVALDATVSPSAIVFIVSRVGIGAGPVVFTTDTGVPLAIDGDVATLLPAAMVGPSCTVTATQTWQGQEYVDRRTVFKSLAFDASTPPAPTGLAATGALASIQLEWAATNNANIGKVEVWRALADDRSTAVPVGETAGLGHSYADNIGAAGVFFYWIRYISKANIPGPFNGQAGTRGATSTNADYLLDVLTNQIAESQLLQTLRDRINLVDATSEVAGSVAARIKAETDQRIDAIDQEIRDRMAALLGEAQAREAYVRDYTYSKVETDNALAVQAQTIAANFTSYAGGAVDAAMQQAVSTAQAYVQNYAYSKGAVDAAEAAQASAITTAYQNYANGKMGEATTAAAADVRNYAYSKSAIDASEAAQSSAITTAYRTYADGKKDEALTAASADVRSYAYSKSGTDSALASLATTLRAEMATSSSGTITAAYVQQYTYSKTEFDNAQAGQSSTLTTSYQQYANDRKTEAISASAADVRNYSYSRSDVDGGFATQFSTLTANYQNYSNAARDAAIQAASADVRNYAYSKADTNGAIASATTTLQSTVSGHTTSIQSQQTTINGLSGMAVLKIDNNGYVAGWGLASEIINGQPTSSFIVNAANFAFVTPGAAPQVMFTGGQVNGETVIGFSGTLMGPSGTLGNLRINGSLGLKAISYNNDVGIWQGLVNGVPKFSIVAPNGAKLLFDPNEANPLQLVNVPQATSFAAGITIQDGVDYRTVGRNVNGAYGGTFMATTANGVGPYTYSWSVSYQGIATGWINGSATGQQAQLAVFGHGIRTEDGSPADFDFYVTCVVTDTGTNTARTITRLMTIGFV